MRAVPSKRPKPPARERTEIKYIPLSGGLNVIDSHVTMHDGMLTECVNYEQVFGEQGYKRIPGYERYDGHLEPHSATYYVQEFDAGTAAISVGDIVTGPAASAEVLAVEITSGAWGSAAAGRLIIGNLTGAWADNDAINVGAQKATASAATYQGAVSEALHSTYLALAIADRRSAISAVPGSGAILGLGIANNVAYAARNVADGTSATLYKATSGGWSAVKTGLYPGGRFRMIQANFSGSTTSLYLFGCDGKNRSWKYDGSTFTLMDPIYGSQGTHTVGAVTCATGARTFAIVQTLRSWVPGQAIVAWQTSNAANRMLGTVTSYNSGTNALVMNVTSVVGYGSITDWEIGLADFSDKPFELLDHSDHMFLAYPYGQLQTSDLGDPMTYATTSAVFGMGDEISGMRSIKGPTLAVYCRNRTDLIGGTSKTTWSKSINSKSSGATRYTVQELAGAVLALDDRGLTSLQATQAFGDFEMAVFSRLVAPYLAEIKPLIIDSMVVRTKNQYRIYASSGVVLTCTLLSPNPQVTPSDVSITRSDYGVTIACTHAGEILGEEYLLFGTDDGYVMREGVGASFDGVAISSVMRLPFSSFKSPSNKKRFRKLVIEIDTPQETTIRFKELFDYSDGYYATGANESALAYGGGGQWDVSTWDTFFWSLPIMTQAEANIAGVGRNMSMLIWHESAVDDAFSLKGLLIHYSVLGMTR